MHMWAALRRLYGFLNIDRHKVGRKELLGGDLGGDERGGCKGFL